jgi:hypothetical protein
MTAELRTAWPERDDPPLRALGFKTRPPANWNRLWLLMWLVSTVGLIVAAFHVPLAVWVALAAVGFGVPEGVSLVKKDDDLPPLTHTIRHFLPNSVAFTLINFALGSIGAHWLGFDDRKWGVGVLFGLLGWLTDHFIGTYARPDPHPFAAAREKKAADALQEEPGMTKLPA